MNAPEWGIEIEPVEIDGTTFRLYRDRPRSLGEVLALAERWGDRTHIVQGDRTLTFDDMRAAIDLRARDLVARGVRPGDRVVILGFNSPEWIINFWSTVMAGGVAVLANAWWTANELDETLQRVSPTLVLADERLIDKLGDYATAPWTAQDDPGDIELPAVADENDGAAVIFTSGTSGHPKAAVLSHRALLAGLQMLLHITRRLPHQVPPEAGEAALHTGPMFHVGGIQTLLRAAVVGDTLVMPAGRFDAADALRLIEQWSVRRWSAVPTMLSRVIEHPDAQTRDLTSLRALTVGGAATHPELLGRIRTGLPGVEPRIATGYGLTENGGQGFAASGADTVARAGTVGRALPCVEVRIGESVDGADGEILLRSPTQMSGYIGEDSDPIDEDGWLHTGDLGRLDADQHLWITGRSKDMIIRGGENIAPSSIERALSRIDGIEDSVAFGVPHPDLGEAVAAAIVASRDVDVDEIRAQLREHLASYAIPLHWLFRRDPFPENHSGKVDRVTVVTLALEELSASTS